MKKKYYFSNYTLDYCFPATREELTKLLFGEEPDELLMDEGYIYPDRFYVEANGETSARVAAENYIGCRCLWESLRKFCDYFEELNGYTQCRLVEFIMLNYISNRLDTNIIAENEAYIQSFIQTFHKI